MLKQKRNWCCMRMACGLLSSVVIVMSVAMMVPSLAKKTSYVYAPGLFGSPIVIGRYCPYYVAPTGEEIHGTRGGNVLGDGTAITAVVFPEVNIVRSNHWFRRHVFPRVANKVFFSLFGIIVKGNDTSAHTFFNYLPEIHRANIGQKEDIATLRRFLQEHAEKFPGTKIVMFGDSRGAATTFNLLALDHPAIACAVLEGIFDNIPHLIKHCWHWKSKYGYIEEAMHGLLKRCTSCYAPEGPFPIDYVEKIPTHMPLLLVTSLCDEIVPHQSTLRLYNKLVTTGHTNVHLLVLQHSSHKGYMIGEDRTAYETCVHAFYQKYGVEYDEKKAVLGREIFATTQPSVAEVKARYGLDAPCCQ